MTGSAPLALLGQTLERYLKDSFAGYEENAEGDFLVRHGSTVTYVRPAEWTDGQTVVRIWATMNLGMRVDGELTRFLATENGQFLFGGFHLDESRPAVVFGHTLLGDFLSRKELEEAVVAVASTADEYDDRIKARFGGRLSSEPEGAASRSRVVGFLRKLTGGVSGGGS